MNCLRSACVWLCQCIYGHVSSSTTTFISRWFCAKDWPSHLLWALIWQITTWPSSHVLLIVCVYAVKLSRPRKFTWLTGLSFGISNPLSVVELIPIQLIHLHRRIHNHTVSCPPLNSVYIIFLIIFFITRTNNW